MCLHSSSLKRKTVSCILFKTIVNSMNIPSKKKYPLPLIPELITQVNDAWVFTKFDICWGYNNAHIKKGDENKVPFKMCYGLFQPKVMYFGLCNSPAMFQIFMNFILATIQDTHHLVSTEIINYMDDILITSKGGTTIEQHYAVVCNILQVLQDHDLFLKPEKCVWESPHVNYLGLIPSRKYIDWYWLYSSVFKLVYLLCYMEEILRILYLYLI